MAFGRDLNFGSDTRIACGEQGWAGQIPRRGNRNEPMHLIFEDAARADAAIHRLTGLMDEVFLTKGFHRIPT
jgi:hypothetical protein